MMGDDRCLADVVCAATQRSTADVRASLVARCVCAGTERVTADGRESARYSSSSLRIELRGHEHVE
jgi:hypothetical protein